VLEPDVRGQLQLLQCEVAFRRALAGQPVDDLGLDPRCQPLRAAALVAAQREGRWERVEDLAGVLLSPARSGTRHGIVSFDGLYWSAVAPRAVAEGRSERGDAAGVLRPFEELAPLEPGNAELHSKAAAARTLITSGR
jgi:hypothetical protein